MSPSRPAAAFSLVAPALLLLAALPAAAPPGPAVLVTGVRFAPDKLYAGDQVTVQATLVNNGTQTLLVTSVVFAAATIGFGPGAAPPAPFGKVENLTVAPGSNATVSHPWTAVRGNQRITVTATIATGAGQVTLPAAQLQAAIGSRPIEAAPMVAGHFGAVLAVLLGAVAAPSVAEALRGSVATRKRPRRT